MTGSSLQYTSNITDINSNKILILITFKPVLRGHLWNKEKVALYDRWPLKRGSIHIKFSMIGHEKVTFN